MLEENQLSQLQKEEEEYSKSNNDREYLDKIIEISSANFLTWDLTLHLQGLSQERKKGMLEYFATEKLPESHNCGESCTRDGAEIDSTDKRFLETQILNPERLKKLLLVVEEELLQFFLETMAEKFKEVDLEDFYVHRLLFDSGLLFICQDQGTPVAIVTDEVAELYDSFSQEELNLQRPKIQLVLSYVKAGTNLYGLISEKELRDMFEKQQDSTLTLEEFQNMIEDILLVYREIARDETFLMAPPLKIDSVWKQLLQHQRGIQKFSPPVKEFIHYADPFYVRVTPEYRNLYQCFLEMSGEQEAVDILMKQLMEELKYDCPIEEALRLISYFVYLPEAGTVAGDTLIDAIIAMERYTKKWKYSGYSLGELEDSGAGGISRNPSARGGTVPTTAMPSKNSPCPCGSGKKYKRCCGA